MERETSIANICRVRTLRHREETRNAAREMLDAIERAAAPLSVDNSQRPFMVPLGRDPYDVWYHILDKVTDPDEVSKLWQVCPLFREILSSQQKYIQTRFPQIVKLILDKHPKLLLENEYEDVEEEDEPGDDVYWARRTPKTTKSILLDLRLISRQCRDSAVKILLQGTCFKGKRQYLTLRTAGQMQTIIDDIQRGGILMDSFFPHCVEVNERVEPLNPERELFWEDLVTLLKLIGKRVKAFRYNSMDPIQRTYEKLSELVLHMTNLESVELNQSVPLDFTLLPVRRHPPALLPNFEDLLPFPKCPQLRSFIQMGTILPNSYFLRVLKANTQIKVVSLPKDCQPEELPGPSQLKLMLQNVECLNTPWYTSLVWHLEFQLPLKEIIFHAGVIGSWAFSSTEMFKFLNQFRDTLQRLELAALGPTGKYFLDLPNLRFFKWKYESYHYCVRDLYFLLHAERLEELRVVAQVDRYIEPVSDHFLRKVTDGFGGSTLWEVFPRLKRLLIESLSTFAIAQKSTDIRRP